MVFKIIIGFIMAASFVGMIVCAKKKDVHQLAKPSAIGLFVVTIICAFMLQNTGQKDFDIASFKKFAKAAIYVLGKELATQMPGAKVLVIQGEVNDNPNNLTNHYVEWLKEGFGNEITDIKTATPPKQLRPDLTEEEKALSDNLYLPYNESYPAKVFNDILAKNRDRNLIINTISMPGDSRNMKIWESFSKNPKTCPKFAMLGGNIYRLGFYINAGLIPAVVIFRPDGDFEGAAPSDLKDCFDKRYILITTKNFKEVDQKYPTLFQKRRK